MTDKPNKLDWSSRRKYWCALCGKEFKSVESANGHQCRPTSSSKPMNDKPDEVHTANPELTNPGECANCKRLEAEVNKLKQHIMGEVPIADYPLYISALAELQHAGDVIDEQTKRITELEKALGYYADKENYDNHAPGGWFHSMGMSDEWEYDDGEIAAAALKGEKKDE
jgi:hypothetical protein